MDAKDEWANDVEVVRRDKLMLSVQKERERRVEI